MVYITCVVVADVVGMVVVVVVLGFVVSNIRSWSTNIPSEKSTPAMQAPSCGQPELVPVSGP